MTGPTRDTTAGRVYHDLRNLARRTNRSTDEIMVEYVLERFLYRLAASPLGREHFVLKGGLLLAQFGARRMTRASRHGQGAGDTHGLRRRRTAAAPGRTVSAWGDCSGSAQIRALGRIR